MKIDYTQKLLARAFNGTCANFQERITRLSALSGKSELCVYDLWRRYAQQCEWADQSALLWEFIQWYAADLGGNKPALEQAIA
jgi:hypothetical protein